MAESRSLFGFEFKRKAIETEKKPVSFTPDNEDGAYEISPTGGYFGGSGNDTNTKRISCDTFTAD